MWKPIMHFTQHLISQLEYRNDQLAIIFYLKTMTYFALPDSQLELRLALKTIQNSSLRISTGCHQIAPISHLHNDTSSSLLALSRLATPVTVPPGTNQSTDG